MGIPLLVQLPWVDRRPQGVSLIDHHERSLDVGCGQRLSDAFCAQLELHRERGPHLIARARGPKGRCAFLQRHPLARIELANYAPGGSAPGFDDGCDGAGRPLPERSTCLLSIGETLAVLQRKGVLSPAQSWFLVIVDTRRRPLGELGNSIGAPVGTA
jgi:hypothetical protein